MPLNDDVLLVLGSGPQQYREYLLRAAARSHRLWLFEREQASWQSAFLTGSTVVDLFDQDAVMKAAAKLAANRPVRGIYCYHEAVISTAAAVAADMGLPGPAPDAVAAVRDKSLTRDRLTRAAIRQPRYAVVASLDEATAAADIIGFPLVVKPRALASSQGVVKVSDRAGLEWALRVSRSVGQVGLPSYVEILLEEFLCGPEISVDAAVADGDYLPFCIAHKQLGGEPFFDETGHAVTGDDPLLRDENLMGMLAAAHQALGWRQGITHTEVKLTPDGPVIVEVNGRLGGDLIPYLGLLASGIDPGQVAADIAVGARPDLRPGTARAAAIRFLCPTLSCVVRGVSLPRPGDVDGLYEAAPMAEPGAKLLVPPDGYAAESRYACLIARADTAAECQRTLDSAAAMVGFDYDPVRSCP